ncbi:hypothetical protein AX762_01755 [Alkalibacterium sp. 20]|nr:hypothetical protein AX762_01755 [Alkalibacterium sp. 20]
MQNEELFKKLDDILNYISIETGERLKRLEKKSKRMQEIISIRKEPSWLLKIKTFRLGPPTIRTGVTSAMNM